MYLTQQLLIQQAVRLISKLPAGVSWQFTITDEDTDGTGEDESSPSLVIVTEGPSIEDLKSLFNVADWEDSNIDGQRLTVATIHGIEVSIGYQTDPYGRF